MQVLEADNKSETDKTLTPNNASGELLDNSMTPNNASGELPDIPMKESGDGNQPLTEDEYPHGLRLFLLAGASIMGVFLISLDQASTHAPNLVHHTFDTQRRPSSAQRYPRSPTSSAALAMSLGTAPPTL